MRPARERRQVNFISELEVPLPEDFPGNSGVVGLRPIGPHTYERLASQKCLGTLEAGPF
jgi:hypothetical protein